MTKGAHTRTRRTGPIGIGCLLAVASQACWEANPAFLGDSTESAEGSSTTSTATDSTTGGPATTSASSGSTGPTTSTAESSGSTAGPSTDSTDTTDGTTTGSGDPAYPPCMEGVDPPCPGPPYEACYPFVGPDHTVCTLACVSDMDCPQPTSGTTPAVCAGAGASQQCVLECDGGAICPDGMECLGVGPGGSFNRCAWPN